MKKTRKGLTLVEVIVSIAVFTIISLALFTSFLGMRKVVAKQEEYVRIEMVCYDINYYWDMYGDDDLAEKSDNDWYVKYFGENATYDNAKKEGVGYLQYKDGKFEPTADKSHYVVEYEINGNELIITSIYNNETKRIYVESVNCGPSSKEVIVNE